MSFRRKLGCIAAGIAGAILIGGTIAALIMKCGKGKQTGRLLSCKNSKEQPSEKEVTIPGIPREEVSCDGC